VASVHRVLVFPSSNQPGLEIIDALIRSPRFEVVGGSSVDTLHDPSRFLLKEHLRCPALWDANFRDAFEALLVEHAIDVVFPTVDALVEAFAGWDTPGVRFVVPSAEAATLCADKVALYEALAGEPTLPRRYPTEMPALPAYAKPARGGGGRGAMVLETEADVQRARERGLEVQELLTGDEYTVDCLGARDGTLLVHHARRRSLVGRGISLGTESVSDPEIDAAVARIAGVLQVSGPWFVQFKRAQDGSLRLLEANARVGGSMTLTRLAGVNIPQLAVHLALGQSVRVPMLRPGYRLVRWLQSRVEAPMHVEGVIWDLDDTLVRADGSVVADLAGRLFELRNLGIRQWMMTLNVDPEAVLEQTLLPRVFEDVIRTDDKIAALHAFKVATGLSLDRVVMVNDSNREKLAMETAFPELVVLTPDAAAVLPFERHG
jgi:carbamoyl-phosphate synthase large subunit